MEETIESILEKSSLTDKQKELVVESFEEMANQGILDDEESMIIAVKSLIVFLIKIQNHISTQS